MSAAAAPRTAATITRVSCSSTSLGVPCPRPSRHVFQAEDVIRALTVTGVQTCALPISPPDCNVHIQVFITADHGHVLAITAADVLAGAPKVYDTTRSEERRVGKGCRCRRRRRREQQQLSHGSRVQVPRLVSLARGLPVMFFKQKTSYEL